MKIVRIWFDKSYIYGADESGKEYRQSLLWYPHLLSANDEQRMNYKIGFDGVHWRELDEDISFESFEYEDAEPTPLQKFFLTHKELNIAEFAKLINNMNFERVEVLDPHSDVSCALIDRLYKETNILHKVICELQTKAGRLFCVHSITCGGGGRTARPVPAGSAWPWSAREWLQPCAQPHAPRCREAQSQSHRRTI